MTFLLLGPNHVWEIMENELPTSILSFNAMYATRFTNLMELSKNLLRSIKIRTFSAAPGGPKLSITIYSYITPLALHCPFLHNQKSLLQEQQVGKMVLFNKDSARVKQSNPKSSFYR